MSIWYKEFTLQDLKKICVATMAEHLEIEFTEIGDDHISAKMPVNEKTCQPYGILHGGASVALAETLGSIAGAMCTDRKRYKTVGLEINANHIRMADKGYVTGTARPIHIGRRTQVWEIKLVNDEGKLTCVSRLTVAVVE